MNLEQLFSAPILVISSVALLLFLILLLLILRSRSLMLQHLDQQRAQIRHSDKELHKANKQLLEVRSVVVGLGQTVNEQNDLIKLLAERISVLENADTDGRLYSRASKMVQLGADINELIEECELPKAEAELMLSLQKKLSGKEKIPPLSSVPGDNNDLGGTRRKKSRG